MHTYLFKHFRSVLQYKKCPETKILKVSGSFSIRERHYDRFRSFPMISSSKTSQLPEYALSFVVLALSQRFVKHLNSFPNIPAGSLSQSFSQYITQQLAVEDGLGQRQPLVDVGFRLHNHGLLQLLGVTPTLFIQGKQWPWTEL